MFFFPKPQNSTGKAASLSHTDNAVCSIMEGDYLDELRQLLGDPTLLDNLSCPVCFTLASEWRVAPCGHSICSVCDDSMRKPVLLPFWYHPVTEVTRCAICRVPNDIPTPNYSLQGILPLLTDLSHGISALVQEKQYLHATNQAMEQELLTLRHEQELLRSMSLPIAVAYANCAFFNNTLSKPKKSTKTTRRRSSSTSNITAGAIWKQTDPADL